MKCLIFKLFFLLVAAALPAQEKGAIPLATPPPSGESRGTTRAVVVGIADYQSPQIPDLRFAGRDAEAFFAWLRSPAGGNIPSENIRLLTDSMATNAHIGSELDWLVEDSQEGDEAIIYFSGHGDVETKTFNKFGFLLAWDTPPTNYKVGAYSIYNLQDIISTLSLIKKTRVTVITDACHSGKLAGSSIGGQQVTAQSLAQQFAGELKIMSCQPNEFSLEGEQWGGGRGAFSYHLVEGLTGLADRNDDGKVNLFEIGRYLQDKVQEETDQSQLPMTAGDPKGNLALVDNIMLAALLEKKKTESNLLARVASKGVEDAVLLRTDSSTKALYRQFINALSRHELLESSSGSPSADDLYRQLILKEELKELHSSMRRSFAVALQDEVQQALNALLESDPYEVHNWRTNPEKYVHYPAYLQRAMELLGERHYAYNDLKAKKLYFEAYLVKRKMVDMTSDAARLDSLRKEVKDLLLEAHRLDSAGAYICHAIAYLYWMNVPYRTDSMLVWTEKAVARSPRWLLPYIEMAHEYQTSASDFPSSEKWLMKAMDFDSTSVVVLERLAWLRQRQNRTDETIAICMKIIQLKPDLPNGYSTLANTFAFRRDYDNLVKWTDKLKSMDYHEFDVFLFYLRNRKSRSFLADQEPVIHDKHTSQWGKMQVALGLAETYVTLGEWDKALEYVRWSEKNPVYPWYDVQFQIIKGKYFFEQGRLQEAEATFQYSNTLDPAIPKISLSLAWLGAIAAKQGEAQKADSLFQEAIHAWLGSAWDDFPVQEESHYLYGRFLLDQNRLSEAKTMFEKANELSFQNGYMGWYGLACLYAKQGDEKQALDYLEKSLTCWYPRFQPVVEEPLFKKLRKTKRFKDLMARHFPEESKK